MSLHELPVEILYCIADELDYSLTVSSLSLVNSRLHQVLNPYLYRFTKQYSSTQALLFATQRASNSVARKLLALQSNALEESTWMKLMSAAAKSGNLETATLILGVGQQLHASCGWAPAFPRYLDSAFWLALNCRYEPVVRLLLHHGAAPVLHDRAELIRYRGLWKRVPLAKLLIQSARQSTVPGSVSVTDLFKYVITNRHGCSLEIVRCFLDHEADLPALFGSIKEVYGLGYCGDPETVRYLLEHGTGSGLLGEAPFRPLELAIMNCKFNTARALLEYVDVTPILHDKREGSKLLCTAALTGSEPMVYKLLQSGLSIEGLSGKLHHRDSPLECAVHNGQEDMVRLLLRHGAKPRSEALIEAIRLRNVSMARIMLDAGADPNCRNKPFARTVALEVAVGHESLFRLLLERGAAIPSGHQLTAMLKDVICRGRVPELQMMLDRGVSLANQRFSLLELAIEGGPEMLKFLYNNGSLSRETISQEQQGKGDSAPSLLILCLYHRRPGSLRWLLDNGLATMPSSATEQHWILEALFQCSRGDQEAEKTLDVLVRHGIDINVTSQTNRPAVWIGFNLKSEVALKAFLDHGAKLLPEHVDDLKPLLGVSRSVEHLEMVLDAVLRNSSREQMRRLLLGMKEYADEKKKWPVARCLERFQNRNGLY